jgi:endonuclease/exonuclease/phosphatase (EEP) superfamily protein YafD
VGARASLKVVSANLYARNRRLPEAVAAVARERADLLALIEMGEAMLPALEPLRRDFPHRVERGSLWVYSRHPLRAVEHRGSFCGVTALTPAGPLRLVAAHAPVPSG